MTDAPTDVINEVLRKKLAPYGFDHADIDVRRDHEGEPALFVVAVMKPDSPPVGGKLSNEAHGVLIEALLKHGEQRFPYLLLRYPDDERGEPEARPIEPATQ